LHLIHCQKVSFTTVVTEIGMRGIRQSYVDNWRTFLKIKIHI